MKKAYILFLILIIFLATYFLQANFFTDFTIAGVTPNLFLILMISISLYVGKNVSISVGIILGLLLDIFIGKSIGVTSVVFAIIGYIGEYLDKSFPKESRITLVIIVVVVTFFAENMIYLLNCVIIPIQIEYMAFLKILLIEVIYNSILTIILHSLILRFGNYIEEEFKRKNIMTKYY